MSTSTNPFAPTSDDPPVAPPRGDDQASIETAPDWPKAPLHTRAQPATPAGETAPARAAPSLVDQAKQQIQQLTAELTRLAESDVETAEFFEGFLSRVVAALAASGGVVWRTTGEGPLEAEYQINFAATGLLDDEEAQAQHTLLLREVYRRQSPVVLPPHAGTPDDTGAGNPTEFLLLAHPLLDDRGCMGVVEVFQRAGAGPVTQRGYLRFLAQTCEIAQGYLKNHHLRRLSRQHGWLTAVEQFASAVHHDLDLKSTAFTIANECRRLLDCDRASVVLCRGGHVHMGAISGAAVHEDRSVMAAQLKRLANRVIRAGDPIWNDGTSDDLAPEIVQALEQFQDAAHCSRVAVLPLYPPTDDEDDAAQDRRKDRQVRRNPVGALVLEQPPLDEQIVAKAETLAGHSGAALANAQRHQQIFLLPLWRAVGRAIDAVQLRHLPKALLVAAVLAGMAFALMMPADFSVEGRGVMQPVQRRHVFAGIDGTVVDVHVRHGEMVERGQPLATLRNSDLDAHIAELIGRRAALEEQIVSVGRALLEENGRGVMHQNELAGKLAELKESAASIDQQLAVYRHKQQQLQIVSPVKGQVVTWDVETLLDRRPVRTGDVMLTLVDPQGSWELALDVPERRMGHVTRTWRATGGDVKVEYVLATHPGTQLSGRVTEIHQAADRGEEGNGSVAVKAAINAQEVPDLRHGATVTAKIDCGRRPLGYVWFHDLIEFVQGKVLFWW